MSSAIPVVRLRALAERMQAMERTPGTIDNAVYRLFALRLNQMLARCPASAIGVELTELPVVWEALADRYFAQHGCFPSQPRPAELAKALLDKVREGSRR